MNSPCDRTTQTHMLTSYIIASEDAGTQIKFSLNTIVVGKFPENTEADFNVIKAIPMDCIGIRI